MNRLKVNQPCPLHRNSRTCPCHPEPVVKFQRVPKNPSINGVKKMPDGREICSQSVLTLRKFKLIKEYPFCKACDQYFASYDEIELGHLESKGLNGGKRDDRFPNLCLLHKWTNRDQGSMSLEDYLKKLAEKGVKPCQQ